MPRRTINCLIATLSLSGIVLAGDEVPLSFPRDVMPHLLKAGCASGNCHSKPEGQNNFKLSVFGYDPQHDYNEIVRDDRGRRVFPAAPEQSLLLLKPTGALPHEGGVRFEKDSEAYRTLLSWIKQGMPFAQENEARLVSVTLEPREKTYRTAEAQQLKITATYSDKTTRDVTRLTLFTSNDKEISTVDDAGKITVGSISGEGVVVASYMGLIDVARITVPADKKLPDELYARAPVHNEIDRLVDARLKKLGVLPSDMCTDEEFLRRASLDSIGVLPTAERARKFAADTDPAKREKLIDKLLLHPGYADHWAIKWGDLVRPNPSRVGVKPVYLIDAWLRESFAKNKPYDAMVRELLTAQGSTHEYGPVAMFRDKREPADASAFVSQIFLGVRLDCARCHHHPSEKWAQEDYFQLAAFFGQMKRRGQGISAPISGEPEYWWYAPGGKGVEHPLTEAVMTPKPPDGPEMPYVDGQDPRRALADWMSSSENPFFAKAIVNRIWAEFFGRGIVDPIDDFRASNPATNPELIDWLARDFIAHGFDLKHLMRTIMQSRTYQLSSQPNEHNLADTKNFSRAYRRRLSAEVLLDAVFEVTGVKDKFEGMAPGAHATQTWNHKINSDFLDAFGRPNASQECPCERDRKPSVVQALHLMNSNTLQEKLASDSGRAVQLAKSDLPDPELVRELYLTIYNRLPREDEMQASLRFVAKPGATRAVATQDLMWALVNSAEFVFQH